MNKNFPIFIKKILVTILYCLIFSGGLFYIKMLSNPTVDNLKEIMWSIMLGLGFSYLNSFELKIKTQKKNIKD